MKRKIIIGLVAVFVLFTAFMVVRFVKTLQEKENLNAKMQQLPLFSVTDINGNGLTNEHIAKENWAVFVFFHSDCHYCQSEAEQLQGLQSELQDITFIWISSEEPKTLEAFQKTYKLEHIAFVSDAEQQLSLAWGISVTPQFLIYTPKGKLFKNHKGALRIDNLISQIHEAKTD